MYALHPTQSEDRFGASMISRLDPEKESSFIFGDFRVIPESRDLLHRDLPVELGGRAFDLLMTLLRACGEIVAKDTIMQQVWPTTTVDESNVRFQMTCLRRALGEERHRIKTVPGRGYLFIADGLAAPNADLDRPADQPDADRPPIVIIDGSLENRDVLLRALARAGLPFESFGLTTSLLDHEVAPNQQHALRIAGEVS